VEEKGTEDIGLEERGCEPEYEEIPGILSEPSFEEVPVFGGGMVLGSYILGKSPYMPVAVPLPGLLPIGIAR
jgi:hypothetical protein